MKTSLWKRTVSMALALILLLCAAPVSAIAAESKFTLIPLEGTDVELDQTAFQYTGQEIRPNVTVRVQDTLLTLDQDYTLDYADNIQVGTGKVIVTGIATASETLGYTGTVEIPFQITRKAPAFTLIELKGTDVIIDGTEFAYTGSPIEPAVTVTVKGNTLTAGKDYSLSYRNNVEVGTGTVIISGIATASETLGYTGTVEIDFTITPAAAYELKGTDVTIEGTKFTYTGSYIEPKVTVTVNGKELVRDEHYTLSYHSNIGVGTATASVNGIESAGYTGQVNVNFTIEKDPETSDPILIQLKGTDVTIDGTEFTYTGEAIEPKVTVKVEGKELVLDRDYSLTYENNIHVGTAYTVVRGIATASETVGYTGEVKLPFSIVAAEAEKPTEPEVTEPEATEPEATEPEATEPEATEPEATEPEATEPEATEPEATEPEATEPEATEPEATEPEATEPETTIPEVTQPESDSSQSVEYKITKGNKSTWYRQSSKNLSFTANGDIKAFEGVKIDGKDLAEKYYSVESGSTVVTLKKDFLQKLSVGSHTITILFEDGEATGTFRVSEGLDETNPQTGDRFNMGLWMSVMGISLAGGIGLFVFRKKIF